MPARRHDPAVGQQTIQQPGALDLDLSALPPAVQAQFNEHLTDLAMMCREYQLDATQVGQAVTMAVTKRLSARLCEDCDSKSPAFGLEGDLSRKRRWCSGCAKAHAGAVNLKEKIMQCQECGVKARNYGLESERVKRWCGSCAKARGAVHSRKWQGQYAVPPVRLHKKGKCEDCALKVPSFGMKGKRPTKRWCSGCAKAHAGAVSVSQHKRCEDCDLNLPSLGMQDERKKRWCSGCAKAHAGAVSISTKSQCEDCGLKGRSFGMESERKKRWCSGCAKAHSAVILNKQCEDCDLKRPSFGMEDERKMRWCSGCAKMHKSAVALYKKNQCDNCGLKARSFGLESERKVRWCGDCAKARGAVHNSKWRGASKARGTKRAAGCASTAAATKQSRGQTD